METSLGTGCRENGTHRQRGGVRHGKRRSLARVAMTAKTCPAPFRTARLSARRATSAALLGACSGTDGRGRGSASVERAARILPAPSFTLQAGRSAATQSAARTTRAPGFIPRGGGCAPPSAGCWPAPRCTLEDGFLAARWESSASLSPAGTCPKP